MSAAAATTRKVTQNDDDDDDAAASVAKVKWQDMLKPRRAGKQVAPAAERCCCFELNKSIY